MENQNLPSQFKLSLKQFNNIKNSKTLPPKIEAKLLYLSQKIINKQSDINTINQFQDLTSLEQKQIDQMKTNEKISMFCSIIKLVTIKKQIKKIKNQSCILTKQDNPRKQFQILISVSLSQNKLYIEYEQNNKRSQYILSQIKISKTFKQHKKRFVFGMTSNKKKYIFIFQEKNICENVHQSILQSIKYAKITNFKYDERPYSEIFEEDRSFSSPQKSYQSSSNKPFYFQKQQPILNLLKQDETLRNQQNNQQQNFQTVMGDPNKFSIASQYDKQILTITQAVQNLQNQNLSDDNKFINNLNFSNGKIMIHKQNLMKSKCTLLMKSQHFDYILQCYLKMNQWNSQVQEFSILSKIQDNTYLIFIKLKKYSWISYQREIYAIANGFTKQGKLYLVLKSVQNPQQLIFYNNSNKPKNRNFGKIIRADLKQIIQIQKYDAKNNQNNFQSNQLKQLVLITILSQINFKGFNSQEDNKNMSINLFKNLEFLSKFIDGQKLMNRKLCLFNLNCNKKKQKQQNYDLNSIQNLQLKTSEQIKIKFKDVQNFKSIQSINKQQDKKLQNYDSNQKISIDKDENKNQFAQLLFKISTNQDNSLTIVQKLVQLIKQGHDCSYLLKHNFDQKQHFDIHKLEHSQSDQQKIITHYGGWEIQSDGNFVFTNKQMLKTQRGYFKIILKKVTAMIMAGQSIRNVSLPAQIFQPKSEVHRSMYQFKFVPKFLVPAAQATDKIEQIKFVTLFFLTWPILGIRNCKSFNPILGQTFSCRIGGIPIYGQQISHHPPITAILIKTETFQFWGCYQIEPKLGFNSFVMKNQKGFFVNFYKTNTLYSIKIPDIQIGGTMFGDRKVFFNQNFSIYEQNQSIYSQISFGKQKSGVYQTKKKMIRSDYIGGVFKVKKSFRQRLLKYDSKFEGVQQQQIIQKFGIFTGRWYGDTYFDNKIVRKTFDPLPNKIQIDKYVLPSDSSLRTDLIYVRAGQIKKANEQKQYLQNLQRSDKKLRQKHMQKKHKSK